MTIETMKGLVDILLAVLLGTSIGVAAYTFRAMRAIREDCKEQIGRMGRKCQRLEETVKILRIHTFGESTKFYASTDGVNFAEVLPLVDKGQNGNKATGKRTKQVVSKKETTE